MTSLSWGGVALWGPTRSPGRRRSLRFKCYLLPDSVLPPCAASIQSTNIPWAPAQTGAQLLLAGEPSMQHRMGEAGGLEMEWGFREGNASPGKLPGLSGSQGECTGAGPREGQLTMGFMV